MNTKTNFIDKFNLNYDNIDYNLVKDILKKQPYSITQNTFDIKKYLSPNDYASNASYYWPDENKNDGLPYIRKNILNPDKYTLSDRRYIDELINDLQLLTLLYAKTEDTKYAKKATEFIKAFFIDSSTRMNPNLDYSGYIMDSDSQILNKRIKVRGNIIDTTFFYTLPDILSVLTDYMHNHKNSNIRKIPNQMKLWFHNMAGWFIMSEYGVKYSQRNNNIISSYYLQLISYLYGSDNMVLTKKILKENIFKVLSVQIDSEGNQTNELKREYPIHYCNFNLDMISRLAVVSKNLGLDVFGYSDDNGRGSIYKNMIKMAEIISNNNILSEINQNHHAISWIRLGSKIYKEKVFCELSKKYNIL